MDVYCKCIRITLLTRLFFVGFFFALHTEAATKRNNSNTSALITAKFYGGIHVVRVLSVFIHLR